MEQQHEEVRKATSRDWQQFLGSLVWQDMKMELEVWQMNALHSLAREEGIAIYRSQGAFDILERLVQLPMVMLEDAELEEEKSRIILEEENADEYL